MNVGLPLVLGVPIAGAVQGVVGGAAPVQLGHGAGAAQATSRFPRPIYRNQVSKRQRTLVENPMEKVEREEVFEMMIELVKALGLPGVCNDANATRSICDAILAAYSHLEKLTTYEETEDLKRRPRNTLKPTCRTINDAVKFMKTPEDFVRHFCFAPGECERIAPLLFTDESYEFPSRLKRGKVGQEELLLVLLDRLRMDDSNLAAVAQTFGTSESRIAAVFNLAVTIIVEKHGHRMDVSNIEQFSNYFDRWEAVMVQLVQKKLPNATALPGHFAGSAVAIDGVRHRIARPTWEQENAYDGKNKQHDLNRVGIVSPDGLMAALGTALPGRHHDQTALAYDGVNDSFQAVGLHGLTDAGFGNASNIHAMPKTNAVNNQVTGAEKRAISGARIGVEWAFGEVAQMFPHVGNWKKMKVFGTSPAKVYMAACLLRNIRLLMRGTQATTFSRTLPVMSVEDYLC
jgi:hypothetical protein